MSHPDLLAALCPVVELFGKLGVRYYVGGSVASSMYGKARNTLDVDVVADLAAGQVPDFIAALAADYYVSETAVQSAVVNRRSFNLIHNKTAFKVDVFIPQDRDYDRAALERIREDRLGDAESSAVVYVASAEDVIVKKLESYRLGNEVSQQQWEDVVKVIELQGDRLDTEYMKHWARELNVLDLLENAFGDAPN